MGIIEKFMNISSSCTIYENWFDFTIRFVFVYNTWIKNLNKISSSLPTNREELYAKVDLFVFKPLFYKSEHFILQDISKNENLDTKKKSISKQKSIMKKSTNNNDNKKNDTSNNNDTVNYENDQVIRKKGSTGFITMDSLKRRNKSSGTFQSKEHDINSSLLDKLNNTNIKTEKERETEMGDNTKTITKTITKTKGSKEMHSWNENEPDKKWKHKHSETEKEVKKKREMNFKKQKSSRIGIYIKKENKVIKSSNFVNSDSYETDDEKYEKKNSQKKKKEKKKKKKHSTDYDINSEHKSHSNFSDSSNSSDSNTSDSTNCDETNKEEIQQKKRKNSNSSSRIWSKNYKENSFRNKKSGNYSQTVINYSINTFIEEMFNGNNFKKLISVLEMYIAVKVLKALDAYVFIKLYKLYNEKHNSYEKNTLFNINKLKKELKQELEKLEYEVNGKHTEAKKNLVKLYAYKEEFNKKKKIEEELIRKIQMLKETAAAKEQSLNIAQKLKNLKKENKKKETKQMEEELNKYLISLINGGGTYKLRRKTNRKKQK